MKISASMRSLKARGDGYSVRRRGKLFYIDPKNGRFNSKQR